MSEIKFSEGIPERRDYFSRIIYPEELLDKKCGGCVRCELRDNRSKEKNSGYHCTMQDYDIDILPEDKACVLYWDRAYHEECERLHEQDIENRRKELWNIYANRDPIKLPIVHDGYGFIPECPICGEMPYSTEQCHWCGQRFVQDKEIEEYAKPLTENGKCLSCGADVVIHISKYNGHKHFHCYKCGCTVME